MGKKIFCNPDFFESHSQGPFSSQYNIIVSLYNYKETQ